MEERLGISGLTPIQTAKVADRWAGYGEEGQPLSPMARLCHEPGTNVYIVCMIGFKSNISPDVVKANLVHTLLKHPRFSSLQVVDKRSGEIRWVPTKVNLEDHVVVPELKYAHQIEDSPDKFVEDYISNLTKTTIDKSQPLWDLHLLNLKTSDAQAVAVFRIHHSLGDGTSLISLLLACTRKVSDLEAYPTIPTPNKTRATRKSLIRRIWLALVVFWNTAIGVLLFVATAVLFLKDTKTPLKGAPGCKFIPRRISKRTVSLDDVKLVKERMNITINDVVLGVTQAALSQNLNRRYGEICKSKKEAVEKEISYLPKNIRLRAAFFFNIRKTAGIQALVDMMEKGSPARWGNKIGYVLLPFSIGLEDDPLDYVRKAKAAIDRKKTSLEPLFSYLLAKFLIKIFGIQVAGILNHRVFLNTTLWFSNIPGPREEISFYGHEIAYLAPTCYGIPSALLIHVTSYGDKLTFIISADEETIPDPHQLCDDLEHSLNLIKAAVLEGQHNMSTSMHN